MYPPPSLYPLTCLFYPNSKRKQLQKKLNWHPKYEIPTQFPFTLTLPLTPPTVTIIKLEQCTKSLSDERYVYRQIVPRRSMENTVKMINSIVPFIRTARNLASKITQNKDLNATESIKSLANQLINYHVPIGNDGKHIKEFFDTESDLGAYMSLVCPRPKKCATITENCMTSDKYQFSEETVDYLEQLDRQEFYHGGRSTSFSYKMLYDNKLRDYFKGEPTRIANQDKYETCALVANSGLVLSKEYGQQIDSHDAVIRCNLGPTKGYEKNVGSKTTFRVIVSTDWMWLVNGEPLPNGMIESQVQTKEEYLNGTETWVLRSASGEKNQPVDGFKHAHNLMGKLKTVALSVDFLERDSLDCSGNVFPTFHAEQTTTGMVGFYFALNHCKKISLYGFQDVTEETAEFGQFTYYDHSLKATWKTYALGIRENMDDEHMVLKVLANAFPDQITMVDQPHL
eukprot:TRINITY_DN877_c0_g1_i8.p1 TRINITY_DN877_c0_g1~~TRINITY_DN877_c0_g1_i8.p1  ORF type:complete len:455 (+),score=110.92 TRINITY_DN877_c0_g1_i8:743-2107(+)